MAHQEAQYYSPDDVVLLDRGNGTSALLHLFGGTLLSWKCNGRENLYLSKKSVDTFEKKTHIRGGVPLVFLVWNPWEKAGAKLPDLDENGYKEFICVEAGKVAKLATLAPGEKYSGTQKFTVIE